MFCEGHFGCSQTRLQLKSQNTALEAKEQLTFYLRKMGSCSKEVETALKLVWNQFLVFKDHTPYSSFVSALHIWTRRKVHERGIDKNQWIKNKIPGNQSSSLDLVLCFQLKIIIYKSWLRGCLSCFYATYKQSYSHIYFSGLTETFVVRSLATWIGRSRQISPGLQSALPIPCRHRSESQGCCIPSSQEKEQGRVKTTCLHQLLSASPPSSSSPQDSSSNCKPRRRTLGANMAPPSTGCKKGIQTLRTARELSLLLPLALPPPAFYSFFPHSNSIDYLN